MTAPATTPTVEDLPLEQLREWPRNPRRISKPRLEQLKRALEAEPEMLRARPLIALPDGTVVAGNQRLRAARELGWPSLPVVVVDLDEARATEWALRDNRPYGEDDEPLVGELLAELAAAGRGLDLTGYESGEVDRLLAAVRPAPAVDPDEAPPLPAEPRSVRGEVYDLGPHRLMCGDATSEADVGELVAGHEPMLLLTDPPYGVELDMEWRDRAGKNPLGPSEPSYMQRSERRGPAGISGDTINDWSHAFALVKSLSIAYVWHADRYSIEVGSGLRSIGFATSQLIVWRKSQFVLSRTHYHSQHEPCWYARRPTSPRWIGSKDQSTVWEATSPKASIGGTSEAALPHPTQKPVSLFTRPFENHLARGQFGYDPFGGSGTTLIAAETTGRRALCMEIDERYCDVIRQRYADFTGQPELAP